MNPSSAVQRCSFPSASVRSVMSVRNRALATTYLRHGIAYLIIYCVMYGFAQWLEEAHGVSVFDLPPPSRVHRTEFEGHQAGNFRGTDTLRGSLAAFTPRALPRRGYRLRAISIPPASNGPRSAGSR